MNPSLFSTPNSLGERMWSREDSEWAQTLQGPTKAIGARPKSAMMGGAHAILSAMTGSGTPISIFMPASGFYVTFTAPEETDLCDYDFSWGLESSLVGVSSTGMLLNASSGIYLAHQFNFALQFVEDTTLVHNRENLRTKILSRLNEQDYGLFVIGPMIAKFLGGFPFVLECSVGTCNHEQETKINLARIINYDRKALTARQLEIVEKCNSSSTLTDELFEEYQSEHRKVKASRLLVRELPGGEKVYLDLEHPNIGKYLDFSAEWVREVEDTNNIVMSTMATEAQRRRHLSTRAEARRLTRYRHMVKAIVTVTEDNEESSIVDEKVIKDYLVKFSAHPDLARRVEQLIDEYVVQSQLSLIGYMAFECAGCGTKPTPGNEFVPISPDQLFFTLAQQVSTLFTMLANPDAQ
jgi:hypothetical protein